MTTLNLEQINKYFVTPNIALLLYSMCAETLNDKVTDIYNVALFEFDDYTKFLYWLENGGAEAQVKVSLMTVSDVVDGVPEKHKIPLLMVADAPNRICLIVICKYEKAEIWCSVTTVNKITNLSLFDEVRATYPKHLIMEKYKK